jgi:hypothetical protein
MKCLPLLLALTVTSLHAATNSYVRVDERHRLVSPTAEQMRQANPLLGAIQPQWSNQVTVPLTNSVVALPANSFGVVALTLNRTVSTNTAEHRIVLPPPERGGLLLLQLQVNDVVQHDPGAWRWVASTEVSNLVFVLSSDGPSNGGFGVDGPEGAMFAFSTNVSPTFSHGDFQQRYHEMKDQIFVWTNINWDTPAPDSGGLVFFEPQAVGFHGAVGWSVRDGSPDEREQPADGDWTNPFSLPWTDHYSWTGCHITNFTVISGALPTNNVNVFHEHDGGYDVTVRLEGLATGSADLSNGTTSVVLVATDAGWRAFPFPTLVDYATSAIHADTASSADNAWYAETSGSANWSQNADYANSAGWAGSAGGLNLNGAEVTVEPININGTTYNVLVVP